MKVLVARAFVRGSVPQVELPVRITENMSLCSPTSGPRMFMDKEAAGFAERASCVIDIFDVESRVAIQWGQAAVAALQIGSRSIIDLFAFWSADVGSLSLEQDRHTCLWGHDEGELTAEAIRFADRQTTVVESLLTPDKYSRVSNALRLYFNALTFQNAEFALLGFVGSLESLFSVAPQELTFRLSLQLSKFLGTDVEEQRTIFHRAKKLYATRSKIAHGDRVGTSEEASAIQIAEFWTPEAEELARLSIRRLLENNLVTYFNSKRIHEDLLTELLFSDTLDSALSAVARKCRVTLR